MANKFYFSYHMLFTIVKEIMNNHKLKFVNDKIIVMADFESSLLNAIKYIFTIFILKGCYFHYIKNLWSKAKKIGLCRKKFIAKIKLIIFAL